MFSRRVFGGTPDTFKLSIDYGSADAGPLGAVPASGYIGHASAGGAGPNNPPGSSRDVAGSSAAPVRLTRALATLDFEFNSDEAEAAIIERFAARKTAITLDHMEERVVLQISANEGATRMIDGRYRPCNMPAACLSRAMHSSSA